MKIAAAIEEGLESKTRASKVAIAEMWAGIQGGILTIQRKILSSMIMSLMMTQLSITHSITQHPGDDWPNRHSRMPQTK